ncbi:unnamed protein product [Meganyctiphanes norvegica]|uniref:Ig-like domain-containing protein n=1 Tax=Meganyctiphanes norvegica TaxID=48144 RepID=A0AAV2RUW0_MEGNR
MSNFSCPTAGIVLLFSILSRPILVGTNSQGSSSIPTVPGLSESIKSVSELNLQCSSNSGPTSPSKAGSGPIDSKLSSISSSQFSTESLKQKSSLELSITSLVTFSKAGPSLETWSCVSANSSGYKCFNE